MWKQLLSWTVTACLVFVLVGSTANAQQEKKKRRRRGAPLAGQLVAQLKKADLTEEQQTKLKELIGKYGKEIKELRDKAGLSAEQRKARGAAAKEANEKGLKGKKRREFVAEAIGMNEAQKEAQEELAKLQGKLRKEAMALLTPEQKQKLRQGKGQGKGKGKGKGKGGRKKQDG